jgi:cytochrome c553
MITRPTVLILLLTSVALGQTDGQRRTQIAFFEQNIRPILTSQCVKCHGSKKQEAELRLDSRAAMLNGGESGPAVFPGRPGQSLLLKALHYDELEMPPSGKLPTRDIAKFRHWIASGAVWPEDATIREATATITDADRNWWAFRELRQPAVPQIPLSMCSENEIDRFVFAALDAKGMRPAPTADKTTLVRRAYFDILGLPPTPAQIDDFVGNNSPNAWEQLIDQLLASPHYGEHWARHWFDVVRYAESDGWNQDAYRPHIHRYRDYVVKSFNSDRPWPQFVRQQLAGDEMPDDNPENLAATGFLRLGIYEYNQRDAKGQWNDIMNEMTDVAGDVFLGVGMACARCHDHKFDPILQRDYFALRAFFEPIEWRDDLLYATDKQQADHANQTEAWRQEAAEVLAKIDALLKPYHDRKWKSTVDKFPLDIQACFNKPVAERTSWEHQMAYLVSRQFEEEAGGPLKSMKKADKAKYEEFKKELAKFNSTKPKPLPKVMAATDFNGQPAPTKIQDTNTVVKPAFLTVLASKPAVSTGSLAGPDAHTTGRRTALAKWITEPTNPLTNRVIVNRIWQYHFGRGLVSTPNDFGEQGQTPTHPELLDWLTTTFINNGSTFKRLHKRILMSATWQQSATNPNADDYAKRDPNENLLWRAPVRRLSAEQIRDAMLLTSNELNRKIGGPSVDLKKHRRSLYIKSLRNKPDAFLHQFDMANGLKSVAERNSTTTPTQALMMINGDYPLARAKAFAKHLTGLKFGTTDQLVQFAFHSTIGRTLDDKEKHRAASFLGCSLADEPTTIEPARLTDFCHILFNSNEFLYVD